MYDNENNKYFWLYRPSGNGILRFDYCTCDWAHLQAKHLLQTNHVHPWLKGVMIQSYQFVCVCRRDEALCMIILLNKEE